MTTGESPMAGRSANPRAGPGGHPGRRIPFGMKKSITPARDNGRACPGHPRRDEGEGFRFIP